MNTLYRFDPRDRSGKVAWMLEELGIHYEVHELNYREGEHKSKSFLDLNPLGQSPAYRDDMGVHTESVGTVMYLADRFIESGLAPEFNDMNQRDRYYFWTNFSTATMDQVFARYWQISKMTDEFRKDWEGWTNEKVKQIFLLIDSQVTHQSFLLGEAFSAADVCVVYVLGQMTDEEEFKKYPNMIDYFNRCTKRPACQKVPLFQG